MSNRIPVLVVYQSETTCKGDPSLIVYFDTYTKDEVQFAEKNSRIEGKADYIAEGLEDIRRDSDYLDFESEDEAITYFSELLSKAQKSYEVSLAKSALSWLK